LLCPFCAEDTKVIDSRTNESDIRRRRECLKCEKRFTTHEKVELDTIRRKVSQIRKRDGTIVLFDRNRIVEAVFRATAAVGDTDKLLANELADKVVDILERIPEQTTLTVEDVQDAVEKSLIESGAAKTAKAYILYREKHKRLREGKATFLDVTNTISEYITRADWRVKENANTDFSFNGLLLYTSGKMIANYMLNEVYPSAITDAHNSGKIHIHDLGNGVIAYCCGWSLKNLLLRGFGGVPNKANTKPAKHLDVAVNQMFNYMGCLQMETAGAQSFASVDTFLAPFIKADNLTYREVKQNMQKLVFALNIPSRWGTQTVFSNLTFDLVVPEDMRNEKAIVAGKQQEFTYADCQEEMNMLNKAFLEVMSEGDADGRIFTFPIPTYNLTRSFDWDSEIADLLFSAAAKYGIPYFQNYIGTDLDPKSVHAMCCRLNIDLKEIQRIHGGTWGYGDNTGSIGVCTINVNRVGYEAKTKEEFFKMIKENMLLARESFEIKRAIVTKNLKAGLMPFTKVYLGSFKNHFSTIGICGMNESCLNFLGKPIGSEEGKKFAIETLTFMRDLVQKFQQETGHLYNLEATPAEGASYRLAKLDKKAHPDIITAGTDVPYLTNSTQLPVNYTTDVIEALEHQQDIQTIYTGGTIFHTFLGERMANGEACKKLVKKIAYNTKNPYFSISPTFSICKTHKYLKGEHPTCPKCGEKTEVFSRVVGYYRPVGQWHVGKQEEWKDRVTFKEDTALNKPFNIEVTQLESKKGEMKVVAV